MQRNHARQRLQLGGRHRRQAGEWRQIAQTDCCTGGGYAAEEISAIGWG
jgi:hypothetical protein